MSSKNTTSTLTNKMARTTPTTNKSKKDQEKTTKSDSKAKESSLVSEKTNSGVVKKHSEKPSKREKKEESIRSLDTVVFRIPGMFKNNEMCGRVQTYCVKRSCFIVDEIFPVYKNKTDKKVDVGMVSSLYVATPMIRRKVTIEQAKKYAVRALKWHFTWADSHTLCETEFTGNNASSVNPDNFCIKIVV